ncbi:MAG: hypothetical protein JSW47_04065 [Phycisphaerales bacterium]|nr:MAG: hypothetical protein JSW47_04065 [Phycisphaerales bacterium]
MNKAQKRTWFLFALSLATLLVAAFLTGFTRINQIDIYQSQTHRILMLFMTIPVILIVILSLRFRREDYDERDLQIWRKALISGGIGALGFLVSMGSYYVFLAGRTGSIRAVLIIHLVYLTCFISILLSSVAALLQYGRGGEHAEQ